jgi:hypothetical protein
MIDVQRDKSNQESNVALIRNPEAVAPGSGSGTRWAYSTSPCLHNGYDLRNDHHGRWRGLDRANGAAAAGTGS